jgi:alpha-L-rhamnosidase
MTQSIRPVTLSEPKSGVYVFDLGVNITGWAQLKILGKRGQAVTLEFHESLNPDGSLDMKRLFDPGRNQVERFILKGEGVEVFEPRFTYHGFRHVQVTGLLEKPTLDSLTGRWVHTDLEPAGEFSCSNPLLNRVHEIIRRTQLCNVHGIPTDCPHREKIGWTCDGCVTMEEAIYNFNMATFYTKWFHDMLDAQDENGHAACIAPCPGWGRSAPDGSPFYYADPWWGGAIIRTPWQIYRYYGDQRILTEGYAAMAKYMDYAAQHSPNHIAWGNLGDWVEEGSLISARTPPKLANTAVYYHHADIMRQSNRSHPGGVFWVN